MEVRPEFKQIVDRMRSSVYGMDTILDGLQHLQEKYKDDDIVDLLLIANNVRTNSFYISHWMYKEHREEMLAYDEEICSVVSDIQHD